MLARLLAVVGILCAAIAAPPIVCAAEVPRVLVMGCITNNATQNYERMQPIANYVQANLADLGVETVEIFTVDSHAKMLALLRDQRVDWVSATAYMATLFERETGAEIVLAKSIKGKARYHSVFFARKDSGIESLEQLKGRKIAFEKPSSTSAFYLPAAEILGAGLGLKSVVAPFETAPSDKVGYSFSGNEANSTLWVHKGIVDAGAYSSADWQDKKVLPDELRDDLVVFHRTADVPRSFEVVRKGINPLLRERLKQLLLDATHDEAAVAALRGYYRASAFEELNEEDRRALDRVGNGAQKLRSLLP